MIKKVFEELEKRVIEESKCNIWYKMIRKVRVPKCLEGGWGERRWARIVRFRLGN